MSKLLPIQARDFIRRAAGAMAVTEAELLAPGHSVKLVRARYAVMLSLRGLRWTLPQIARAVNRHHSTVMHGIAKARILRSCDAGFIDLLAIVKPEPIGCEFIAGITDQGPPRAAKGGFPYPGHGTLTAERSAA